MFDPIYIILQIVCLQCLFYLGMGTIWTIAHGLYRSPMDLRFFFSVNYVDFVTTTGWIETFCMLCSGLLGAYLLSQLVERAKKCVDFTFTLYFIHILACTLYQGEFPLKWEWWTANVFGSVIMASLGEYLCANYELQDIPLYAPA